MYFVIDPRGDTMITIRNGNDRSSFLSGAGTFLLIELARIKKIWEAPESDPVSST